MSSAIPKDDILPGGILPSVILNETIARVTDILGDELDVFLDRLAGDVTLRNPRHRG